MKARSLQYLSENDVTACLSMSESVAAVRAAFQSMVSQPLEGAALGAALPSRPMHQPRRRSFAPGCTLHSMSGILPSVGLAGTKTYTTTKNGARFQLHVFSSETGEPVALIEANRLGQMRTGATSAVAVERLTAVRPQRVVCIGSGFQATTQIEAIAAVRPGSSFLILSRNVQNAEQLAAKLTIAEIPNVSASADWNAAISSADIIVTATSSKTPVLSADSLPEGVLIVAVGSNIPAHAEVDSAVVALCQHVVCDDLGACQLEAGDLIIAAAAGRFDWSRATELAAIVGTPTAAEVSVLLANRRLFKSVGLALEDLAVASVVLKNAADRKLGTQFGVVSK